MLVLHTNTKFFLKETCNFGTRTKTKKTFGKKINKTKRMKLLLISHSWLSPKVANTSK
jgi:hypothetical protein